MLIMSLLAMAVIITTSPLTAQGQNVETDPVNDVELDEDAVAEPTGVLGALWRSERRVNPITALRRSDTASNEFGSSLPYQEGILTATFPFFVLFVIAMGAFVLVLLARCALRCCLSRNVEKRLKGKTFTRRQVILLQELLLSATILGLVGFIIGLTATSDVHGGIDAFGNVLFDEISDLFDIAQQAVDLAVDVTALLNHVSDAQVAVLDRLSLLGTTGLPSPITVTLDVPAVESVRDQLGDVRDSAEDVKNQGDDVNLMLRTTLQILFVGLFVIFCIGALSIYKKSRKGADFTIVLSSFGLPISFLMLIVFVPIGIVTSDGCVEAGSFLTGDGESPLEQIADCTDALQSTVDSVMTNTDTALTELDNIDATFGVYVGLDSQADALLDDLFDLTARSRVLVMDVSDLVVAAADCDWVNRLTIGIVNAVCADLRGGVSLAISSLFLFVVGFIMYMVLFFLGLARFTPQRVVPTGESTDEEMEVAPWQSKDNLWRKQTW